MEQFDLEKELEKCPTAIEVLGGVENVRNLHKDFLHYYEGAPFSLIDIQNIFHAFVTGAVAIKLPNSYYNLQGKKEDDGFYFGEEEYTPSELECARCYNEYDGLVNAICDSCDNDMGSLEISEHKFDEQEDEVYTIAKVIEDPRRKREPEFIPLECPECLGSRFLISKEEEYCSHCRNLFKSRLKGD